MRCSFLHIAVCVFIFSPLRRVIVQFFLTSLGCKGSSKEKGAVLGSRSASTAVILMPLFSGFSHITVSGGKTSGALSLTSRRRICRVPVLLAGGIPGDQTDSLLLCFLPGTLSPSATRGLPFLNIKQLFLICSSVEDFIILYKHCRNVR